MDDQAPVSAEQYRHDAARWRQLAAAVTTAKARAHLLDKARLCEALADRTGLVARPSAAEAPNRPPPTGPRV